MQPFAYPPKTLPNGFTLIELLVVIAISAILLAVAVPMFSESVARTKVRDASNALLAAIELTRSEAIKRGINVSLCRVGNPGAMPPACSAAAVSGFNANDWAIGWAVFAESDPGGAVGVINAADEVVVIQSPFAPGTVNARVTIPEAAANAVVTFAPAGIRTGGGALSFGVQYPSTGMALESKTMDVTVMGKALIH